MNKNVTQRSGDNIFDLLLRHPFVFVALMCVLLPLGFSQAEHITASGVVIEAIIWILGASALFAFGKPSDNPKINTYLIISSALVTVLFSLFVSENGSFGTVMFIPVAFGLVQLAVVLYREKKLTADRLILLMMVLGVVARYCYVLKFDCSQIQHDVGRFDGEIGHEPYIMYWYKNGLALPDFDVTTRWQFYHPPLHHILMALGLRVFTTFGMSLEWAQEAIQILPMLYSALSMVACYRIFKLVRLHGAGLVAATAIVCFYPTFIIWGGAYNNDMLATLFMLLAILWTLKWYQKPSLRRILPIALCIGLGMSTKLSAWMVAPAVAIVFLWTLIRNIKKPLPFIGQFAAFGAAVFPLGLWWGIRNLLLFNIPITYVPDINSVAMSVETVPVWQRLFDFSLPQFTYPFMAFTVYHAPYNEYNPLTGLLKTSIFDEYNTPWNFSEMATVFVVIAAVLALFGTVCLVWWLIRRDTAADLTTKIFFVTIFVTILISYYLFCFEFPYVCTENIRYCIPVIPILALATGFGVNRIGEKLKK